MLRRLELPVDQITRDEPKSFLSSVTKVSFFLCVPVHLIIISRGQAHIHYYSDRSSESLYGSCLLD